MIVLDATTKKLQLVTTSIADVHVVVSYADTTATTFTPGVQTTAINSVTTTDILAAPAASTQRLVKSISIVNAHASSSNTVSVVLDNSGTDFSVQKDATLSAGAELIYEDGAGWTGVGGDLFGQYALLLGRAAGQTLHGGAAASENLVLRSTSHATLGLVNIADTGGNVAIGGAAVASKLRFLEPSGSGTNYTAFEAQAQSADISYTLPAVGDAVGQVLSGGGTGVLSWRYSVSLGTEVTAAGTSVDFTGIPAWARAICIHLNEVSTNGTSGLALQIGDSGGIETSGYRGSIADANGGSSALTGAFGLVDTATPSGLYSGHAFLVLEDSSDNTWTFNCSIARTDAADVSDGGGRKSTSAALDRVRITTVGGVNTFDAGVINISYW